MTQQVKICPKCGTQNKSENAACAVCFTSLATVPTTISEQLETPTVEAGAPPSSPAPSRPASNAACEVLHSGIPGGPIGAPFGSYAPPPRQKSPAGAAIGWIIAILVIGGIAFAGWWFLARPASPDQVVKQLIDASKTKNVDKMMAILCKSDIDSMGGEDAARKRMEQSKNVPGANSGEDVTIGAVTYEGENTALVEITPTGNDAQGIKSLMGSDYKPKIVTVREDGKWKISLQETTKRMMAEVMKAAIKKGGGGFSPPGGMPTSPH